MPDETVARHTERTMLGLLARRHAAVNQFGFPRWVYAEKVYAHRYGGEVDAIALDGRTGDRLRSTGQTRGRRALLRDVRREAW